MKYVDFDFFEEADESETDVAVESISAKDKILAYGLYVKLQKYKSHYYTVKLRYKILASTWIIATFIGLGYLLSGYEIGLPTTNLTGVVGIGILSSIGLSLLYYLDIFIYHRILHTIFLEAMHYEKKYDFLPPMSLDNLHLFLKRSIRPVIFETAYYSFFILVFLLISDYTLYVQLTNNNHYYSLHISLFFFVATILYVIALHVFSFDKRQKKESFELDTDFEE